jgi:hypothetical protein|tara:strand:+ start:1526 stop:2362 length:837 start_codon:yes stop_codon:yes gene_type:complete
LDYKRTKLGLCFFDTPENYKMDDIRFNKPQIHRYFEDGKLINSIIIKEIDQVKINKKEMTYFTPNNVAILLSISSKSYKEAKALFNDYFKDDNKIFEDDVPIRSTKFIDYIESIQTSIVFSYTALETFINLSIPEDYIFENKNNRGIIENYNKEAIERWLDLKNKLNILREVYKTNKLENQKWWSYFILLEQYRNSIIHQKSIKSTGFYKEYFKNNIFEVCTITEKILKFFYEAHESNNQTNSIWPWLINESNSFPVENHFDSNNLKVVGNKYEGIKR